MSAPEPPAAALEELRARVATLEHLLEVHERIAAEQTKSLQAAKTALQERNQALQSSEKEKSELVERLRLAVDELSTPILEVWDDVLALPIIGLVDARRAAQMTERLLDEIARKGSSYVIVDVTGVEVVDADTAEHFAKLVRAVELMGSRCVVTGVQPAVGQALYDLGHGFGRVRTLRNLKHALHATIKVPSNGSPPNGASPPAGPARRERG